MDCCYPSLEGNKEPEKKKQKLEDNSSDVMHDGDPSLEGNREPDNKKQKLDDTFIKEQQIDVVLNNNNNNDDDEEEEDQALLYDSDGYSDNETRQSDLLKYNQQLQDSNGFQVDYFPKLCLFGMFTPVLNPETNPLVRTLSQLAIDDYNNNHVGAHYEFVRVVRSTFYGCAGSVHYITFEAKLPAAAAETFQAQVYKPIPDSGVEVLSCERKATN